MDTTIDIAFENKVRVFLECNASLKRSNLSTSDEEYTLKMQKQFRDEIKILVAEHPALLHHFFYPKIKSFI